MRIDFYKRSSRLKRAHCLRAVSLAFLGLLMAGCPAGKPAADKAATAKVVIRGSNTIGEELGPRLIAEYRKEHPEVAFDLEAKGTGYGFAGLCAGTCDIAAASRTMLKGEQELMQVRGVECNDYVIGSYSVTVIVNGANSIADLSRDQVRDIFTGAIQNWKAVGGSDAPIHLCIRDPISGTSLGFRELAMENKDYTVTNLREFTNYTGIAEAVANDQNAIGYVSPDLAGRSGVKAIPIGGVGPSVAAVQEGKYPFARVLRLYTVKSGEPLLAREFIQFVVSPRGQAVVEHAGFVRHP